MRDVDVLIATLDEERHIERVIDSARELGNVFVVDAGSGDRTQELARNAGAHVVEHAWAGYAQQKNWALENLPFEAGWVLLLDADEYLTPELRDEIRAVIAGNAAGAYVPRLNIFLGRPLKHAWWYPDYQLRLFRLGAARFEERRVHEHALLEGEPEYLKNPLMHENLKGIDAFVTRHLVYARLEAQEMEQARREGWGVQRRGRILGSWAERRRFLKVRVWYRMPFRPAVRFLWIYVVRRGFLDGRAGLVYASLLAMYEIMINAEIAELRAESRDRRESAS